MYKSDILETQIIIPLHLKMLPNALWIKYKILLALPDGTSADLSSLISAILPTPAFIYFLNKPHTSLPRTSMHIVFPLCEIYFLPSTHPTLVGRTPTQPSDLS